jgi:hypothetical protein
MPIWLHATLYMVSNVASLGGAFYCIAFQPGLLARLGSLGLPPIVIYIGLLVLAGAIPHLLFSLLIPARCPKCGRAAFPRFSPKSGHGPTGRVPGNPRHKFLIYECRTCGHVQRTFVGVGKHDV